MILKASQRGGGMQLAAHLLKSENEHVEIHEVRGFIADDVKGAMKEAQAVAKGTKCRQHLFSVSLSPPETESVSIGKFEAAIDRIEKANGLIDQPRMIIFHEKEGRRHAHCVWSRIDAETMTARPLPFFKMKLREISKGLYLEHGWRLPKGLVDSREHDPKNFSHAEWQQAKRIGQNAKQLKALVQECWAISDGRPAFEKALQERGLYLAKGERRAHVAVTYEGEVVSVARTVGVKTKDVKAKLGDPDELRSIEATRQHIASTIAPRLGELIQQANAAFDREMKPLEMRRQSMAERHQFERQLMADGQRARWEAETRTRADRFRSGLVGLWDRLTGKNATIARDNEREAFNSFHRDREQRDELVADQLRERQGLQREIAAVRLRHQSRLTGLHRDLVRQQTWTNIRKNLSTGISRNRSTGRNGPGLGL